MNQGIKNTNIERLGFTFHRTFPLKRSAIKQVLELVCEQDAGEKSRLSRQDIRDNSELGTIYVESMPRWAWGSGLLTQTKQLTIFGKHVCTYDKSMEQLGTQWLMHYYLSSTHGPGPTFWHQIVFNHFRSGDDFTQDQIAEEIASIYSREKGKELSSGSATSTANAFLETYVKSEGLGNLGLLEEIGENHYRVLEIDTPPIWPVAVAVIDYWQNHFPRQVTVNLSNLTTESGLASIFMISRSRLDMILGEMREVGIVDLFRVAPPYQVALLDSDPEPIFRRMYTHE